MSEEQTLASFVAGSMLAELLASVKHELHEDGVMLSDEEEGY